MSTKLGLLQAGAIIEAMLKEATQRNIRFAAAIVDSGGELIQMKRMDGASPLSARMAFNKAYTAVKWMQDTKAIKGRLFDLTLGNDVRDIAWFGDSRFTPVWGGIVLWSADGTLLGALGGSGGTPDQDEEIGQIGASAIKS
jgi:uncharacterized protein GlcG (DUF336 family)